MLHACFCRLLGSTGCYCTRRCNIDRAAGGQKHVSGIQLSLNSAWRALWYRANTCTISTALGSITKMPGQAKPLTGMKELLNSSSTQNKPLMTTAQLLGCDSENPNGTNRLLLMIAQHAHRDHEVRTTTPPLLTLVCSGSWPTRIKPAHARGHRPAD